MQKSPTLLIAALLVAGCAEPPPEVEPIVRPVRYARVSLQGAAENRVFSGTTQAALETDMSFKVAGTITGLPVEVGDIVAAGQQIATMDVKDYQVRVQEAQAGLAQARAELRNAESSYGRARSLYENRNISRGELDAARAAAESAQALLNAAGQQLQAARLQLSYTRISAPQECTVAAVYRKENENVSAGQPIMQLNCGDCSEISVTVPETIIDRVEQDSDVEIRLAAMPDARIAGKVIEVGVAAAGTAYSVTVVVTGDCPELRSGMAADVHFRLPIQGGERRIVVPPVSVGEDRMGNYAFVLEPVPDSDLYVARRRDVEVAGILAEGLLVTSGLTAGELIATAGVRRITDGLEVRLLDSKGR